jgi:ABC-type bacteriocin/lantibiotic exporter with double-glycine peptidase domain
MRIPNVPYYTQEQQHTCGPASLRMLLAYYGVVKSEAELEVLANASTSGTCNYKLADTARLFLDCTVHTDLSLERLFFHAHREQPVLINYINPVSAQGHYAIFVGYTAKDVILHDPKNGAGYRIPHTSFDALWVSGDGLHTRWGMVYGA